jgi:hypothetical protein
LRSPLCFKELLAKVDQLGNRHLQFLAIPEVYGYGYFFPDVRAGLSGHGRADSRQNTRHKQRAHHRVFFGHWVTLLSTDSLPFLRRRE